jgi:hypothetical protein
MPRILHYRGHRYRQANPSWWGLDETGHHTEPADPTQQVSIQEVLDEFDDLLNIACDDGNWNYDPYLHGMANGMILLRSTISGEENPKFLDAPEEWLKDHPTSGPALEYQAGFHEAVVLAADLVPEQDEGTRHSDPPHYFTLEELMQSTDPKVVDKAKQKLEQGATRFAPEDPRQGIAPRQQDLQGVYYHGTSEKYAKKILREGLVPPPIQRQHEKGENKPVAGRVYLSRSLTEAIGYADTRAPTYEPMYIFVIKADKLACWDIQPDEDKIESIARSPKAPMWLKELARQVRVEGDSNWVGLGKKLLPIMTDEQKATLLNTVIKSHVCQGVAVGGRIMPDECWQLPHYKVSELNSTNSNFFSLAKQVPMKNKLSRVADSTLPKPTQEMFDFFKQRTKEHISRVQKYLQKLDGLGDFIAEELTHRGKLHDADKYGKGKVLPYVWVTEYYRVKNSGEKISEELQQRYDATRAATGDHVTINRHHPESHYRPNDMTDLDIAEMVADWSAMAEELGEGSARGWADKNVGSKWKFDEAHTDLIYKMIDRLEGK